mmetsp:Transcript_2980/g.4333  ORF Transcript_2980/g.4333 Transcript_2980/m.4333 type:complete len:1041 (+) Transcript_2980:284-3406(+)
MSHYGQKPENALRRAMELTSINQNDLALSTLHEILSLRRNRTWSPTYEKIMIAYIDLCLSLNKPREAKDGLHQYRNLSQSQAPGSLENVIRYLIEKSEEKCRLAKEQIENENEANDGENNGGVTVTATATTLAGDLDGTDDDAPTLSVDSTNMLLLSTMTADPEQNQRESMLLLPRVKFLWEAYRAVLDILKSNSKLERLYHDTARGALEFCSLYKRRTEFRRLCDLLRTHLQNLQKYGGTAAMARVQEGGKPNNKIRGWEGWTTESIELQLQVRFKQLDTASSLHLYTEGFKTVEDIFNILQISHSRRKTSGSTGTGTPKAQIMAAYYDKLTTLFWVSENYLFHAFAWYKFYTLCREYNRGMTDDQKRLQASAVLLSALCIPSVPSAAGEDSSKIKSTKQDNFNREKTVRMATLLGFHTRNPTREALLSEIRAKNVMVDVPDYLRELYNVLEQDSNPLVLVQRAKPLLDQLRSEVGAEDASGTSTTLLSAYVEPLISVLLLKLMHSLSASYHNISLDHIKSLTDGLGVPFAQVEKAIISAASNRSGGALSVRIDHRANCLRFGDLCGGAQLESDTMRSQLTVLSKQLSKVCNVISPPDVTSITARRQAVYAEVRANVDREHEDMLARKELIEKRKEETERQLQEKAKAEEQKKAEAEAMARAEEEKRLVREQQLREKEKQEKIKKELEISEKKNYLKAMGRNVDAMTEDELCAVDVDALAKEHAAKAAKKKDDAERKIREVQKKLDYIVRAVRIEEVPLVKKQYEDKVKAEKERYEADVIEKARRAKLQWEEDCKAKADLSKFNVFPAMKEFEMAAMVGRKIAHEAACNEEDIQAEQIAEKAKMQRARKRKDDEIRAKREEEERLKKEEEARKAEEEKQRREEERRRKEQEQEELRKKKEAERSAMMRERERERAPEAPSSRDLDNATGPSKYVPPSRRGQSNSGGAGGSRWGDNSRNAWGNNSRGTSYGGGRYEGGDRSRYNDRGGGDRGGEGYGRDRTGGGDRGGNRYNNDRDRGTNRYPNDRDRGGDRYKRRDERW